MDVATAFYAAAAVLLVVAGVAKLVRPASAALLMEDLGAPASGLLSGPRLARGVGAGESALGVAALALEVPGVAVGVGMLYTLFSVTVVRAIAVGAESCGCFGRVEAPPSWVHVTGNAVFAVAAFAAASASSPLEVMAGQPMGGVGFVVVVGVMAGLALTAFTALPEALAASRPQGR